MSVLRCESCDKLIDLDYEVEHLDECGKENEVSIEVRQYSTPYECWFVPKVERILTGKVTYKMIICNVNEIPF